MRWNENTRDHPRGNINDAVIIKSIYRDENDKILNNYPLAERIYDYISNKVGYNIDRAEAKITLFNNSETDVKIRPNIRKGDCYVIHDFYEDPDKGIVALLLITDALKRASANSINLILPFNPYERADWKPKSRKPISAKVWAKALEGAGMTKMMRIDMHADQLAGFYDSPVDALSTDRIFGDYIMDNLEGPFVVGTIDTGGNKRSERLRNYLEHQLKEPIRMAYIDKGRPEIGISKIRGISGDVENSNVIINEDIIDTGGSLANGSNMYIKHGAREVNAFSTVGIFSFDLKNKESAADKMKNTKNTKIRITDAKYVSSDYFKKNKSWLVDEISLSELFGTAIYRNQLGLSVSDLFPDQE